MASKHFFNSLSPLAPGNIFFRKAVICLCFLITKKECRPDDSNVEEALVMAAFEHDIGAVDTLLQLGVSVDAVHKNCIKLDHGGCLRGVRAIDAALWSQRWAEDHDPRIVQLLLMNRASPLKPAQSRFSLPPLIQATDVDSIALVKSLILCGADVNEVTSEAIDSTCNESCLHRVKSTQVLELLLQHGANPNIVNSNKEKPWEVARTEAIQDILYNATEVE